ncbi:transposase [Solemya velum gill symbiont]|uniref:transposase n=1 Tax=Solemya velum gill symbiont TaxID=2340 RepID=UPI00351D5A0E
MPEWKQGINRRLASLRTIVESPFRIFKRRFGFSKVRYRGLSKNDQALAAKFAQENLCTCGELFWVLGCACCLVN